MRVLGISAFYHDSAAALIEDGSIVGAGAGGALHPQEARFGASRSNAVEYCLDDGRHQAGRRRLRRLLRQAVPEVRAPARDLSRLRAARLQLVPHGHAAVAEGEAVPEDAAARRDEEAGSRTSTGRSACCSASITRAMPPRPSSPRPSRRPRSCAWTASANGRPRRSACGQGNKLEMLKEIHFPHSLGLLYSAFTYYTGFKVNSGEYKVMGLAPYGEPKFKDTDPRATSSTSRKTAPSASTRATSTIAPACA